MSSDQNKKIIEQFFSEVINRKNLSVLDHIIAPNFRNYSFPDAPPGPEGFKGVLKGFLDAFPDIRIDAEHIIAEGDMVASRGFLYGTNSGSFMGMPPTGKKVRFAVIDFWRIQNGKAVENWVQMDSQAIMTQLGVTPEKATA